MHRFFIPHEQWNDEPLTLSNAEAHHCAVTLRHQPGDKVTVINGQGGEATAAILSVDRARVELNTLSRTETPKLPARIDLGQAIPKGRNMDLIVQKATELGAHSIIPVVSERTVVKVEPAEFAAKTQKWRQVVIEAVKQCGRAWLPEVCEPSGLRELLAQASRYDLILIASLQPDSRSFNALLGDYQSEHGGLPKSVLVLIGPEGDYTPAEMGLARSMGCQPVSLGPLVLRAETAAIYSLSVLANVLFEQDSR